MLQETILFMCMLKPKMVKRLDTILVNMLSTISRQRLVCQQAIKGLAFMGMTVSGVYSSGTVKYAVWSDTNGQDDVKWYDATTSGTTATSLINVTNHSGTGTYHVHVYQSDNGQMYFLTSTDFTVKRTNYSTPYYNQRDDRWANTRYGYYTMASTGCVPTSLSMVFSSLTGNEVLPTTVASYLYNNTVEFNRGTEGTTGNGILVASRGA